MTIGKSKIDEISQNPGVYIFKDIAGAVLYVGKATNLRSRVRQYFSGHDSRATVDAMVPLITDVEVIETDSVLEALILEANLIKKYLPKYNVEGKDDKSWTYVVFTKEDFPRVVILRQTDIAKISNSQFLISDKIPNSKFQKSIAGKSKKLKSYQLKAIFGPYLSKKHLEIALKIMRRIFPIHQRTGKTEKGCLDFQIGLCPGPYAGAITKREYQKNVRGIRMILEGKKKRLVTGLEKEMKDASGKHEYEKAAELRNKIFALNHIRDVALISRDENLESISNNQKIETLKHPDFNQNSKLKIKNFRIEGYDISMISGKYAVGSMVVFENGQSDKSEYRKFKIKTVKGIDDVAMMAEVLSRRLRNDWPMPGVIIVDGGKGHYNMAKKIVGLHDLDIPVIAVAKGAKRKKLDIYGDKGDVRIGKVLEKKDLIRQVRDESHRFAVAYHRKLRSEGFGGT